MRLISLGVVCRDSLDPETEVKPIIENLFQNHKPNFRIAQPKFGEYQVVIWDELVIDPTYDLREMRKHIMDNIPDSDVFLVEYHYTKSFWDSWGAITIGGLIGIAGIITSIIIAS